MLLLHFTTSTFCCITCALHFSMFALWSFKALPLDGPGPMVGLVQNIFSVVQPFFPLLVESSAVVCF